MPIVNWLLMLAPIGLVLGFGTSSNLAAAYGVAVTTTMVITTVLALVVARRRWHWSLWAAGALRFGERFTRIVAHYGFMEQPNMRRLLDQMRMRGVHVDIDRATFFLGRETLLATGRDGMALWRERLFATMTRNAQRATAFFGIPPERVVELGSQIEF